MQPLKDKLAAFQRSGPGQFLKKISDDQFTNLAALLAWNVLSALLPLLLGVLAIAGLILRDPARVNQVYGTMTALLPAQMQSGLLGTTLDSVRQTAAAPASIISLVLLLVNGSSLFSNMETVFDHAYHVQMRNVVLQRVVALVMLVIVTALLLVSMAALGIGSLVGHLPIGLPVGPLLGRVVSWSISVLTAIVTFLLLYKIVPNKAQSWRSALPGALAATALFFLILFVFPIYLALFPPNQAYALFGILLVFLFYLYLLSIAFTLGAELNAFLEEPARAVALAEATAQAQQGHAAVQQQDSEVQAQARGTAPALAGTSILGQPAQPATAQAQPAPAAAAPQPAAAAAGARTRTTGGGFAGKLVGLAGLVAAVVLLRNRTVPQSQSPSGKS